MRKVCASCQLETTEEVQDCPDCSGKLLILAEDEEDPLIGNTVDGRYVVQSLLGQGGMGSVYRAHQKTMNRDIALKVLKKELSSDPQIVKRFLREVQAVSVLRHPNTITVYDFGQTPDNLLYIAMEYLEGRPLSNRLREDGPMILDEALDCISQCCGALSEAHDKGIVHRDLKPDNIFLADMGGKQVAKVLDFGIAKLNTDQENQTQLTRAGLTVGTPPYMSPEQAEGRADITAGSDLYSMGCILFECLSGRPPFVGDSPVKILMEHCTSLPPKLVEANPSCHVPSGVQDLISALLEKDTRDRPASSKVLQQIVEAIRRGQQPVIQTAASQGGVFGATASFDSAEVNAALSMASAEAIAHTSAIDSVQVGALAGAPGQTELSGEAVPVSTEAALASMSKKSPLPIVAAIVLGLAGVGGYFALQGGDEAPSPSAVEAPAAAPAAPAPEAKKDREIWVRSKPSKAEVMRGKEKIGTTPLKVKVDPENVFDLKLIKVGFVPYDLAIDPGIEDDQSVTLMAAEAPKKSSSARSSSRKRTRKPRAKPRPKAPKPADDDLDDLGLK